VHPAWNIHDHPDAYEIENTAIDPDGTLRAALWERAPWAGKVVVDLGCGTGFHLPRFAVAAAHVIGVEPHDASRVRALQRVADLRLANVSVMTGSAERILLPDASVDVVHSMFAYFFGPGSDAGVAEVARVLRPGGVHVVVDNDWTQGTFASWLRRSQWPPGFDWREVPGYWAARGYVATPVASRWRFTSRADLERVVAIEFPPALARAIVAEHQGLDVDYHYVVYSRTKE
jgi:SAM-dependent methyltransferase